MSISKQNRYTSKPMSKQTCPPPPMSAQEASAPVASDLSDLLEPYEKLVNIEILGKRVEVPEKNRLLRCFQYLSINTISYGDFCWNGDCTNCQIWYHTDGQTRGDDRTGLSCRMEVVEGMTITAMASYLKLDGITK